MATKNMTIRTIIQPANDTGAEPVATFDETVSLSGYSDMTASRRMTLAAAGSDVAVTFTNAALLFIFSHDNKFSLRLGAGQTLLQNLKQFGPVVVNDATNSALATSVLLSGNGTTPSDLEIWITEKYTA